MKLKLYYAPISCSLVPYVALIEAGAKFDVHVVNFMRGEQVSDAYLRINPKHKVPVLLIDGAPLTENIAILQWIAAQYPQANLLPRGGLEEFKAISFLAWCAAGIHPHLTPNVLPERYCDLPGTEESVRRCAQKMLLENFQIAEDLLAGRDWFFDRFTLADAYFFWCFRRGMAFKVDMSGFPNCRTHFNRVSARASVQNLISFEERAMASFQNPR
jgi:glutathione S-transferase